MEMLNKDMVDKIDETLFIDLCPFLPHLVLIDEKIKDIKMKKMYRE